MKGPKALERNSNNAAINLNGNKRTFKIIFSSPSSVECFFKNYTWDESYKAVVIGKTTAKYLPSNVEYIISKETSIDVCIKLAKKWII